jgi:uncharacterized membrane protein (DUF373 family)
MTPDPDLTERPWTHAIPRYVANLQRFVVVLVLVLVLALLGVMIARLGWLLGVELIGTPIAELSADQFLSLFSFMLLVLIGVELVEAVQLFLSDAHVHVEFLILIALTAICRKILILDPTKAPALTLIGIAALVVALAGAYFLIRGRLPESGA